MYFLIKVIKLTFYNVLIISLITLLQLLCLELLIVNLTAPGPPASNENRWLPAIYNIALYINQ